MKRRPTPELLDSDAGTDREIAGSIRDLQMFNEWFGGVRTGEALVRRAMSGAPRRECSLLEIASGNGYVPKTIRQRLAPDIYLRVTLLDRARNHLNGNSRAVVADALSLPFPDNSFDLVSCNLFVHHLGSAEVQAFAREALRVSRVAFLINDLVRDRVHLALAYAGFPLYRSRITRHDAPASICQSYTPAELRQLLESSARQIDVSRHYLYRMGIIAWKRA
jgi:hypothetical protein